MKTYKGVFEEIFKEVGKVIVGQEEMVENILASIMCDSNALLEGYPGLAKTMAVRTVAEIIDLKFSRIQNTPDLMPSDITGTYILEEKGGKRDFTFQPGPIFANIVLADEINRATPKTQSALLEAMQEKQVTVGNATFKLDLPFFVLATMNPIEQEGTFPLPEAQADRFIMKIKITYPDEKEELEIIDRFASESPVPKLRKLLSKNQVVSLQGVTRQVPVSNDLKKRVIRIVMKTRELKDVVQYGASPRASIGLILASKARALINGRNFVSKEDIEAMAAPVLRHRLILNFEAERKGLTTDDVVKDIVAKTR